MRRSKLFRAKRSHQLPLLKPWPKGVILGVAVALFLIMTFVGLNFTSKSLKPAFEALAQMQAQKAISYAFNYSLSSISLKDLASQSQLLTQDQTGSVSSNDFFYTQKNKEGKLVLVSYNTAKVNAFLYDKTQRLQAFLYALDNGTITLNPSSDQQPIQLHKKPTGQSVALPFGLLTHMPLLGNLGPKAPLRFDFLSTLSTQVIPQVQSASVNTVHLTLYVKATTHVHLIFPFETKTTSITKEIPIADITVQGDVPKLYH